MLEININTEGPCAKAFYCIAPLGRNQKNAARGKELFIADGRVFIQVKIAMPTLAEDQREYRKAIDMKKTYFMDVITGTLYFDNGRCMATAQIKPRQFVRDDKLGVKILSRRSTA